MLQKLHTEELKVPEALKLCHEEFDGIQCFRSHATNRFEQFEFEGFKHVRNLSTDSETEQLKKKPFEQILRARDFMYLKCFVMCAIYEAL